MSCFGNIVFDAQLKKFGLAFPEFDDAVDDLTNFDEDSPSTTKLGLELIEVSFFP